MYSPQCNSHEFFNSDYAGGGGIKKNSRYSKLHRLIHKIIFQQIE
nr:MAG TPA: hypothetical protein [Caudoviricetes sp.]